ncbi:hypothetical protein [Flavobacterium cerinum]|uniref:SMI1/KNR4 family protein n=1 Tax=Flavobacterium cerinum TaxID=2502784 RepID=A0ABY5IRQ6_9FLAO|nr:hypothetical protein [Flavobacterium cerinum]UUC44463.1 hypothetical protein NOX80_12575 [Flavobacterium cerinum]
MSSESNKELTERLKDIYSDYFDSEYLDKNLEIPHMYTDAIRKINIDDLFSLSDTLISTQDWMQMYADDFLERKAANKLTSCDIIFLVIGEWGSRHDLLLCCDTSSPDFGKVFDYNDAHPWWSPNDWEAQWTDFRDFIKSDYNIDLE